MRTRKYLVVVGSLMSGLGKGIVTASIGKILQSKGVRVVPIKFDGYLNVDCGTMNPLRHGEVYVLDDGNECDMDLGTYERFLNLDLGYSNSLTGGKIFKQVIEKERRGGYLGYDVQMVPHLTNEIKKWIRDVGEKFDADVVLVEVGGTAGDLENGYFLEAMRQLAFEEPDVMFVQLTYVPTFSALGEQKTKPTQHATRLLQSMGIQPDVIICREEHELSADARKKLALFCNVCPEALINDPDVKTIYEVPELFEKQGLGALLLDRLKLENKGDELKGWGKLSSRIKNSTRRVNIGITGKYTALKDAYVSIKESLVHAGAHLGCTVDVTWIETTDIEEGKKPADALKDCDGIIVPGGFGARGTEGKIQCIQWAREHNLPFLGICFGMQLMVVEYARNVCGLAGANSTEIDEKTPHPVIDLLPEQKEIKDKGATMRLGGQDVEVKEKTLAHKLYGEGKVRERFRHRYEVNAAYVAGLEEKGLVFSGREPVKNIMQIAELPNHPFFIAAQFHPEFTSRLEKPNPLFVGLLRACLKQ